MTVTYTPKFFSRQEEESAAAASVILPILWRFMQPHRVVDLGCGTAGWLATAHDLGAGVTVGIDGDYVPRERLRIPEDSFVAADLARALPVLDGTFDLAMSVEVLEHLPAAAGARAVAWLCAAAPVVLFSAALPGQGGDNHVNEDWLSNWASVFERSGYLPYDIVRPLIWNNDKVAFWYRQNVIVFATQELAARSGFGEPAGRVDVVHPEAYKGLQSRYEKYYGRSISGRLKRLRKAIGRRSSFD